MVGILGGAVGGAGITIVIRAVDQYSKEFNKIDKTVKKQQSMFKKLTGFLDKTGIGYAALAGAVTGFASESIKAFLQLERAQQSFGIVVGKTADALLTDLRAASKGMVSDFALMEAANRALALGIEQNKLPELLKTATALSKVFGRTVTEAFDDITIGIGRQSKLILDNLGIIVDTELAYERYAKTLGKTASELTDMEKKQAFVNEVLQQTRGITAALSAAEETHAEKIQKVSAQYDNLKGVIGEIIFDIGDWIVEQEKIIFLYDTWQKDVKSPEARENLRKIGDEIKKIADETKKLREENEGFLNDLDKMINDRFPQEIALEMQRNALQKEWIDASEDRKEIISKEIDQIDDELSRYDIWRNKQDLVIEGWQLTEEQSQRTFNTVEQNINDTITLHDSNNAVIDENIEKMRLAGEESNVWADDSISNIDRVSSAFGSLIDLISKGIGGPIVIASDFISDATSDFIKKNTPKGGLATGVGTVTAGSSSGGGTTSSISKGVSQAKNIASSIGSAIGGTIKSIGSTIGGIAKSIGNILGFEKGGLVPGDGLAMLHKDEFVVPASQSNRGGTNIVIKINNLNGFNARDIAERLQDELEGKISIG